MTTTEGTAEPVDGSASQPAASADRAPAGVVIGASLSLLTQAILAAIGIFIVLADEDWVMTLALLAVWCTLASIYTVVALIVLGRQAKHPPLGEGGEPARLQLGTVARAIAVLATVLPSFVGLVAAVQVLLLRDDETFGAISAVLGVWAMLLAWGMLHWGYAQLYFQRHYRSILKGTGPLYRFPQTPRPRVVDFAYFSFTVGTAFSTSDVEVISPAGRWIVVWHEVISFFFNGLIIVFALNTILSR